MSLYVNPGASQVIRVVGFATGLTGTVGVQILNPDGTVFLARATAGVSEHPASSGIYWFTFMAPATAGSYEAVWDNGSGGFTSEDIVVTSSSLVPVSATLNANALTSVANLLAWLRRGRMTGNQSTDDVALAVLAINGASDLIIQYTEREFFPSTGLTRTFEYGGNSAGYLDFSPYDLRNITSITIGGAATTMSTGTGDGDFVPMPRNRTPEGTYTYLTMRDYYRLARVDWINAPIVNTRDVVIVGDWGMVAVPPRVELACLIAAADLYRNPEQGSSRGAGDFQVTELQENPGSDESLPAGARRILDSFVRPKVS
jgi:hypothetical protein